MQHESERLDMQQQHQSEIAAYRIEMSSLEDTVWQKIERIARLVGARVALGRDQKARTTAGAIDKSHSF